MSRIGKHPVAIPGGVDIAVDGQTVKVKGKLGSLEETLPGEVVVALEDGSLAVRPRDESKRAAQMWGLARTLVQNMVTGVSEGFTRRLDISGVGYRAAVDGNILNLQLGFSHDIKFAVPPEVKIACETPTAIVISGFERQRVGQIAAEIRSFRPPEPYKGKGVRYSDEVVRRKEGKKK
ncbi:MAG: 50S ribosomal protein L6 [Geminicoccaceae bacterium]|jgi:large subunit ribosomal protein L6|nr:50S ribosomal protein L6 [Geminicoccaceae bacterium]HRY24536.1 50S ribosomal protein L6 [Geminicoccaceae bacterium]